MDILEIKETITDLKLHPLIEKRWSPRAFSNEAIDEQDLEKIFTAASWAASSMNEQPWQYIYATKDTPEFEQLLQCLNPGNQSWSKNAPVIFVALYRTVYRKNNRPNRSALHDLGMANAQLLLQATALNIYGHLLGGFDSSKLEQFLSPGDELVPFCMGVLGYLGDPDILEEPHKTREVAERKRNSLDKIVRKL